MKVAPVVAQSYVRRILENERDTLKLAWIVVMGAALTEASIELSKVLPCLINYVRIGLISKAERWFSVPLSVQTKATIEQICLDGNHSGMTLVLFFVFVLTVLRFLWGDNRLIDAKYVEVVSFINDGVREDESEYRKEFLSQQFSSVISSFRRSVLVLDVLFIIFHGVVFIFLAKNIGNHDIFVFLYIFLLVFNSFWLTITWLFSRHKYYDFWKVFVSPGRMKDVTALGGPWRWAGNNIIHAGILIVILCKLEYIASLIYNDTHYINEDDYWNYAIMISAITFFSNSIFDFSLTWSVYFPRVGKIYKDIAL